MKPAQWEQIKRLYLSALEHDESRRAAFLEETCAGDWELRREVESLLAHRDQEGKFVEEPALEVAARALAADEPQMLRGRQLGSYKILSLLGAGGMGEVYRAHDTKLGREVAIKVLPEEFARDPERLARFRREAQLLAALNHPNISAIHGFEESDGLHYLVLEFVPGETLAQRLAVGRVDLEEALKICGQIAEALEAAHEKGIIHRDLKPANIKVTPGGRVKVLDFGLAQAFAAEVADQDRSQSPSITETGTGEGVILGTAAYMSPEQTRGKPLDKRSDIWSFGCVLYEALTGRRAFAGETVSDTIAAILERDPDWSVIGETVPPGIRLLLRRCLKKDLSHRLHDIADARIEIEEVLTNPAAAEPATASETRLHPGWRRTLLWGLTSSVMGAIAAIIAVWFLGPRPSPTPPALARFAMALPANEQLPGGGGPALAVSPDGTHLVYEANSQLHLRPIDSLESKVIPGTEGAHGGPFFSPDGRWIGFYAKGKLKKVAVTGGEPVALADVALGCGANWETDGTIVYTPFQFSGVMRVPATGGTPQVLTGLDPQKGEI